MVKWFIVILLILVDQSTKAFIVQFFPQSISYNQGIAFGLLPSNLWLIINLILILSIVFWSKGEMAASLIISGGISNLLDRIFRGAIIDYINLQVWPSFNFADALISIGLVFYLVSLVTPKKAPI